MALSLALFDFIHFEDNGTVEAPRASRLWPEMGSAWRLLSDSSWLGWLVFNFPEQDENLAQSSKI